MITKLVTTLFLMMTSTNSYYGNLCGSVDNDDGDQVSDHYDYFYHVPTQVVLEGAEGTL